MGCAPCKLEGRHRYRFRYRRWHRWGGGDDAWIRGLDKEESLAEDGVRLHDANAVFLIRWYTRVECAKVGMAFWTRWQCAPLSRSIRHGHGLPRSGQGHTKPGPEGGAYYVMPMEYRLEWVPSVRVLSAATLQPLRGQLSTGEKGTSTAFRLVEGARVA